MPEPFSHYVTLQVPSDATADAIRSAYKALALASHPDRNQNSAESHRKMQALNAAFAVLNDPVLRAAHDRVLAAKARPSVAPLKQIAAIFERIVVRYTAPAGGRKLPAEDLVRKSSGWVIPVTFVVMISWLVFPTRKAPPPPRLPKSASVSAYTRPLVGPNGLPWPTQAAELTGLSMEDEDVGQSEITIDNSKNSADAYVRLNYWLGDTFTAVRHIYVPAFGLYSCKRVRMGRYRLDYQELRTGTLKQSETFEVTESKTTHSVMRITLLSLFWSNSAGEALAQSGR